jgi:uncharacterized membrane protein HdeD (DUF308 family)
MIGVNAWLTRSRSLFPDLRDAGLPSGLGEQLKVLRLLQLLEERGAAPKTSETLAQWIAPVLCSRSDQFKALRQLLDAHFPEAPRGSPIAVIRRETAGTAIASTPKRGFSLFWPAALLAAVGAAGAAALFLLRDRLLKVSIPGVTISQGGDAAAPIPVSTLVTSSVVIIVLLAVVAFLLWRRIRLAMRHGHVAGEGKPQQVRIEKPAPDKDNPQLLAAARVLNRPHLLRTGKLDVGSTVRATAEAGGRFSPVELVRRVPTNWLLLVERGGAQDPLPAFGERLSTLLARSGVRHTLYEFRRSPQWVRREGPRGRHMPLERALAADRPTRVLMLAEASRVIDGKTGGPARWLTDYDVPAPVILLTPNARENWSAAESIAAQAGVLVLPADADGLSTLARRIQAAELEPSLFLPAQEAQFERWQAERFTWLSQSEPARAVREKLIATLRALLRKDEFRLLVGIAAFPEVRLDLMTTLDSKLHPQDTASTQRTRLLRLGRLVWLKEGIIPNWLREDLMRAVPGPEVREVRESWMELLANEPHPGEAASSLTIHLAEGSAEAGAAQGDGLFLGFLRGKYDLPAPLRFVRLAGLWRSPDRTELLVAVGGIALACAVFIVGLDVAGFVEDGLRTWHDFIRGTQAWVQTVTALPKQMWLSFAFISALAASYTAAFASQVKLAGSRVAVASTATCSLLIVVSAWLGTDLDYPFQIESVGKDFIAPLIVAGGVAILFLWRPRLIQRPAADLIGIIQGSRGTGLSDRPTLLVLLWLFLAGVLNAVLVSQVSFFRVATWWLIAIAGLGVARAALISWSEARLQPTSYPATDAARVAAVGLALGQLVGAALAWILISNLAGPRVLERPNNFLQWHVGIGFMLFGAAAGLSAALWRRGLIGNPAVYWCGALALVAHGGPAAAALLPIGQQAIFASAMLPLPLLALLFAIAAVRPAARPLLASRPFFTAVLVITAIDILIGSGSLVGIADTVRWWLLAVPLVLAMVATWPLIQRLLTDEPPVASEPAGWRPRPVAPQLWVVAPLVLVTVLQIPLGPVTLDLPTLVVPLAILLSWRFGLRGFRTTILMILPALWFAAEWFISLLSGGAWLDQPPWFSPITLDLAVTALVVAALFARPGLVAQVRATSQLPMWGLIALALMLSLQIRVPDIGGWRGGSTDPQFAAPEAIAGSKNGLAQREPLTQERQGQTGGDKVPGEGERRAVRSAAQQKPEPSSGKAPGGDQPRAPSEAAQPGAGAAQGGAAQQGSGSDFSGSRMPAQRGWNPATFLVLALFLIANANLGWQATVIIACVALAGSASVAVTIAELPGQDLLVWYAAAGAGLIAYGVGRYHGRISRDPAAASGKQGPVLLLSWLALIALGVFNGQPLLPPGDVDRAAFLALAALSAWTAGIRGVNTSVLRAVYASGLALLGLSGIVMRDPGPPTVGLPPIDVFAQFLPAAAFLLGTWCRDAVRHPAPVASLTEAVVRPPPNKIRSGLFLSEGIILVALGLLAIMIPLIAPIAVTIFLGWLFLISGIAGLVTTVWARQVPGFWWSLLSAVFAIAAGILLLGWPLYGAVSLTLLLIVFFIIEGVFSIMCALALKKEFLERWGWMLASGVIDLILAVIIFAGLPGTAAWALSFSVGIYMLFGGSALIAIALHARRSHTARSGKRMLGLEMNQWVTTIFAVMLSAGMIAFTPGMLRLSGGQILMISIPFGLSIGAAVIAAVWVAQRFLEHHNGEISPYAPIAELTAAALIVAGFSAGLRIGTPLLPALIEGSDSALSDVVAQFAERWPGVIIPFACTISLGLLCIYLGTRPWSPVRVAVLGALANGLAFMAAAAVVAWLLPDAVLAKFYTGLEYARALILLNSGLIGVAIGFMVLWRFKRSERDRRDDAEHAAARA